MPYNLLMGMDYTWFYVEANKELCRGIKETLVRLNKESGADYELTASIGYASYVCDISGFRTALSEADDALYREKAART